jgi:hypothetical protein
MQDYKYGYKSTRQPSKCATSKRSISRFEMFMFDILGGLLGAAALLTPCLLFIYL